MRKAILVLLAQQYTYIKTIHNTGMNHRKVELFERSLVHKVFDFVNTIQGFLNLKFFKSKTGIFYT
jgi:hypothetical protein